MLSPLDAVESDGEYTRQEILASNLRYGSVAQPLRIRAYAQVVLKVLLSGPDGSTVTIEQIRKQCGEILGRPALARGRVELALQFLGQEGLVEQNGKRVRLRRRARDDFRDQISGRRSTVEAVLDRHFPGEIERPLLREWFDRTGVRFFSIFGDRWVASVARSDVDVRTAKINLEEIATSAAREVGLDHFAAALAWGFREFIRSSDAEENTLLWHLGRAMFAARLMAADLASDPISTKELRGSHLLLDTNVLLSIAVEQQEHRAALQGLARALEDLEVTPEFIYETREEYQGVVGRWREQTLAKLDRFGSDVVRGADDAHIRAAGERCCVHREDFERFFDQLYDLPKAIEGVRIVPLDDEDVAASARAAANDPQLLMTIQDVWQENRPYSKTESAARHDAALTGVARKYRVDGERCWVLSTDRTMQTLAGRWARPTGDPLWMTLDTILQILAVEEEGSGLDATAFAPLLSQLVSNEVETCTFAYKLSDVQWLDEMIRDVDALPAADVQALARKIHYARVQGAGRESGELRLLVERELQTAKSRLGAELNQSRANEAAARRDVERAEGETRSMAARNAALNEQLVHERAQNIEPRLLRDHKQALWRAVFVWLSMTAVVAFAALVVLDAALPGANLDSQVQLVLAVAAPVLVTASRFATKIWPRYKEQVRQVPEEAKRRASEELGQDGTLG